MVLAAFLVLWAGQIGTGIGLIRELLAARTAAQGGLGWVPVALVGAARRAICGTAATAAEGDALLAALDVGGAAVIFLAATGGAVVPTIMG